MQRAIRFARIFTSSKRQRVSPVFLPTRGNLTRWRFELVSAQHQETPASEWARVRAAFELCVSATLPTRIALPLGIGVYTSSPSRLRAGSDARQAAEEGYLG